MFISADASTLIKPGHILVRVGSDLDYYLGQWVIRVSDAEPVSTLVDIAIAIYSYSNII